MPNDDMAVLSFLVDKWSHQDGLIYRRLPVFWAIQAAVVSVIALAFNNHISSSPILAALGIPFLLIALIGWQTRQLTRADRRVRNTFNKEIVEKMITLRVLKGSPEYWDFEHWTPENDSHPTNLWHTPDPRGRGQGTRGSGIIEQQILMMIVLDLVLAFGIVAWSIALLTGCA
jgi:hypothetical protein